MINFIHGDLFDSGADVLVNPVNCVGVMGKGLALQFRHRYPGNYHSYQAVCRAGKLSPGNIYAHATSLESPGWILNVATKNHWQSLSLKEWIVEGLHQIRKFAQDKNVETVALPAIGAGLGGLPWPGVRQQIGAVLHGMEDTLIKVYMPHKGANDPENYDADVLFNNYGGSNVSLRPITEDGYQALLGANIGIRKGGPDQKGDYPAGRVKYPTSTNQDWAREPYLRVMGSLKNLKMANA